LPETVIAATEPWIWEGDARRGLEKARPYTLEYRSSIEGDVAAASVDFIRRQAREQQPFFLYVGWTHTHYPTLPAPEFVGKSRIGAYGDAIMELDRNGPLNPGRESNVGRRHHGRHDRAVALRGWRPALANAVARPDHLRPQCRLKFRCRARGIAPGDR
jgi:hypothetical protein